MNDFKKIIITPGAAYIFRRTGAPGFYTNRHSGKDSGSYFSRLILSLIGFVNGYMGIVFMG